MNDALLTAVHEHALSVVTLTVPVEPPPLTVADIAPST